MPSVRLPRDRRGDFGAPPCSCGGRGQCFVCEAAQAVRLSDLKRSAGGGFGAADFHTRNLIDRPIPLSPSPGAIPVMRKMGSLLGLPTLRNAGPDDATSPLVTRATNLGGMITASLLKLPADRRESALEDIGGLGWAQEVLRVAATMHGKLAAKDAVHFALTLQFIIGATQAQEGKFTPAASAYVRAYNLMAKAQGEGHADSLGITKRPAMGGFGRTIAPTPGTPIDTSFAAPVLPAPLSSVLASGDQLVPATVAPDRWLRVSPNGRTILMIARNTGNPGGGVYVLYKAGGAPLRTVADAVSPEHILANSESATGTITAAPYKRLWSSTSSTNPPISLEMGTDGVMRYFQSVNGQSVAFWNSTAAPVGGSARARPGARAEVQNDGNVVAYAPEGGVVFSLETYKAAAPFLTPLFKAPPEIPSVDYNKFNVEYCQRINPSIEFRRQQKKDGIRVAFNRVFGRMPNNAEITHYGAMVWCIDADGKLGGQKSSLENAMEVVRQRILDGEIATTTPAPSERDMRDPNPPSANPLADLLSQGVQQINNVLCEGFKALAAQLGFAGDVGTVVANVLCQLISTFTTSVGNTLASASEVIVAVIKALVALVTGLGTGRPFDAIMGFMRELTVAVFFAVFGTASASVGAGAVAIAGAAAGSLPVAASFLLASGTTPEAIKLTQEKVRLMAYAAADKDPLFPLTLAISVISLIFMPTPQTVLQLAMVLVPVVSALAAPALQKIPALASSAVATIQKGMETLLRLAITVAMGITALSDLVATIQKQITESLAKDGALQVIFCNMAGTVPQEPGDPNPPANKSVAWCIATVMKRLTRALDPKNPQSITAAIQKIAQGAKADGVVDKINTAAVGLLALLPALLLVFAGGAIEADPSLRANINQWFITANAVPGMLVNKDVVEVNTAMRDLLGMLSAVQQGDAVYEQQRILDIQSAARVTAKDLWQRVGRDGVPTADRDLYFKTLREQWVAQGGVV